MLLALLALSCRTTKVNTSAHVTDSLEWNRKVSVTLATIPSSLAGLTIPMDSLRKLPPGASYTAKSGQAGLRLEIKGNQLHATATCDSLQQLVFRLEEELHQARDELKRTEARKEPVIIPFLIKFKWCLIGILIGTAITIIIKKIKK